MNSGRCCYMFSFSLLWLSCFLIANAQVFCSDEEAKLSTNKIREALGGTSFHSSSTYYNSLVSDSENPLLSLDEIASIHNESSNLVAVIHIGPMKTGSSSIQSSFHSIMSKPEEADGYEDTTRAIGVKNLGVWNVIGCFRHPDAPVDGFIVCKPEVLASVHQVARRRHNLVLSAEYLTSPDTNIAALKDFLKPWKEQKVVAYYRRYYDWLHSFHNQGNKNLSPKHRQSLVDFLKKENNNNFWWKKMYITEAMNRWKEHFSNVEVFNIHEIEDRDVRDSFFCKALPQSPNTCNKFRMKKDLTARLQSTTSSNPSVPFVYEDIAYYSKVMGLWSESQTGLTMHQVALKAKEHQENDLNLKAYDFGEALECPDEETAKYLLDRTLESEKLLFPGSFSSKTEQEINDDFKIQIRTKLCHVHSKTVIENSKDWQLFFNALNHSLQTNVTSNYETRM